MLSVILVFFSALLITGFSTPFVRKMALALGFVDTPSKRKLHATPMPLMGGVAIFGGLILVLAIYFGTRGNLRILGLLASVALIAVIGLIDDRNPMSSRLKFAAQSGAFVLAIALGTRVALPIFPQWVNYVVTFVWFAIITNAVNFLDNMDGLCAGVVAVASAFIVLMADVSGQFFIAPLAAATLGACLGFLRYNFKPARIFMGDAGSLLLGFMLAVMTLQLRFPTNSNFVTWMVPIFLMGVPLFDLALITVARLRRGVNPFTTAGKDHTSHRLVRIGFSQREAVLIIYLLGGSFGMIALFITQADVMDGYLIGSIVAVASALAILWLVQREI
jgi:UDP-GlcNAc:undecaprenyl-phosphate GlcNAc-1-phosphate transferase